MKRPSTNFDSALSRRPSEQQDDYLERLLSHINSDENDVPTNGNYIGIRFVRRVPGVKLDEDLLLPSGQTSHLPEPTSSLAAAPQLLRRFCRADGIP